MLTLPFHTWAMMILGVLTIIAVALLWIETRRKAPAKQTLQAPPAVSGILLICGLLPSIPVYIWNIPVVYVFGGITLISFCAAIMSLNQRVVWDERGFWYRTILRRTVRYEYADIRRIKKVFKSDPMGGDLYVHAGARRFLIDGSTCWMRFASAYENWQTRNGQISWRQAEQRRYLDRYYSHGPFRRRLDRIPGGHFLFVLSICFGVVMLVLSIICLSGLNTLKDTVACLGGFVLSMLSFGFPYSIIHMDDRPKLLRRYLGEGVRIRPDPDAKPKMYRRVRRKNK